MPRPGDIARVRHRQYLVDEVLAPAGVRDSNTLVRLTCLDDDAQGRPLAVLWERELGAQVLRPETRGLANATRLDEPRHFAAYLHALKWSSVTATDARLFPTWGGRRPSTLSCLISRTLTARTPSVRV